MKVANKGYKPPKWFTRIKPGAHGSTPSQKRLWRIVSETYRKEDWEKYGAMCPLCKDPIYTWQDGQLGHFHPWGACHSWFKFERKNLALICAGCNMNDSGFTAVRFADVLKRRYGDDILTWIERTNQTFAGIKMQEWELVDYAARVAPHLVE